MLTSPARGLPARDSAHQKSQLDANEAEYRARAPLPAHRGERGHHKNARDSKREKERGHGEHPLATPHAPFEVEHAEDQDSAAQGTRPLTPWKQSRRHKQVDARKPPDIGGIRCW